MSYFFGPKKPVKEEKLTDRELLRVLMDELFEFCVSEVDREGPFVTSRRLERLAERIERHLKTEKENI